MWGGDRPLPIALRRLVCDATGGWRIVHAFNTLNALTVPAETLIPRKDVIIDGMTKSIIFSSMDLMD